MANPKRNRSRSKIKIEKQVQDLKASIADKSGTDEERSIEHAENMADILDGVPGAWSWGKSSNAPGDLKHDLQLKNAKDSRTGTQQVILGIAPAEAGATR
jgi:hypothetical protein